MSPFKATFIMLKLGTLVDTILGTVNCTWVSIAHTVYVFNYFL